MIEPPIDVLLVDDDESLRVALAEELTHAGFRVETAADGKSALQQIADRAYDVAIVDLNLPGLSGEELIVRFRELAPTTEIIVLTAHGTVENAVRTLKNGAYDFLTKPCSLDELEAVTKKAYAHRELVRENRLLQRELARHEQFREFVGDSVALRSVLEIISKVAPTDSTALIQGESGVGKELAARAIFRASRRAHRPFIVVDCTSLQESLLQSELFGHERGAFTGAISRKHGLFEVADGGTLFLDEIGELSLPLQARLLRVLDGGTFRRVGGVHDVSVNVRLIFATNRDLLRMTAEGQFRRDLYYRVNVVSLTLPPLRERREDIPLLANYFARESHVARKRGVQFSPESLAVLQRYSWPGNVRELQNVVERALILAEKQEISVGDLPGTLRFGELSLLDQLTAGRPTLEQLELGYIERLLEELDGHRGRVATVLGISERTLYRKLKERVDDDGDD